MISVSRCSAEPYPLPHSRRRLVTLPRSLGNWWTGAGSGMIRLTFPPLARIISVFGKRLCDGEMRLSFHCTPAFTPADYLAVKEQESRSETLIILWIVTFLSKRPYF